MEDHRQQLRPFVSLGLDITVLAVLLLLPVAAALSGARGPVGATLNLGPGDSPYVSGFAPDYEIVEAVATHWTEREAAVRLPLSVAGPAELSYRLGRPLPETEWAEVAFAGKRIDRFTPRRAAEVRHGTLGSLSETPVDVLFAVESTDPETPGLKLDWVRVETGPGGRLRLQGEARWRAALLVGLLFALLRAAGWDRRRAGVLVAPWASAAAAGLLIDPWLVHRLLTAVPESMAFLGLLGLAMGRWLAWRGRIEARSLRAVTALLACAFLVRAVALNHPDFYYPDLRSHAQLAAVVRGAGWDFLREPSRYILQHGVWYRVVGDRSYAFPYTPAFHVPFALMGLRYDALLAALKIGAAAASALPIAALWTLSGNVGASRLGPILLVFVPIYGMHLVVTYLAAIFGHAVDMAFLSWLSGRLPRISSPRVWLGAAAFVAACELSYVSAVTILPIFVAVLAAAVAIEGGGGGLKRGFAVLGFGAFGSLLAVVLYYRDFLGFALDTVSGLARGARLAASSDTPDAPVKGFFELFYSYNSHFFGAAFCLLAVAGLALLLRRGSARVLLAAWAATYLLLLLGRAKLPFIFQHPHDALFVTPLVCLAAGEAVAWLAAAGGRRRVLAGLLLAALVVQGTALQWHAFAQQLGNAR